MAKQLWKPTTLLNPVPVVMVTCQGKEGIPNIITLAWVGTVNSDPPMVSISVRKDRHSYNLLKEKGEFVINVSTKKLTFAIDLCGVKSGKNTDKFKAAKLTPEKASKVSVPLIKESPINLECVIKKNIELGSHVMFIAEIVAVNVDESLINEKGKLCLEKADLICYSHGEYWSVEKPLGYFGFAVNKKKTVRSNRNMPLKAMKNSVARASSNKATNTSSSTPIKTTGKALKKPTNKTKTPKAPTNLPIKAPTKAKHTIPKK